MSLNVPMRPVLMGLAVVLAATSLSGCSWFRKEPAYMASEESRPLEVPPDLVLPSSSAALQIPPAAAGAPVPGETPPSSVGPATTFSVVDSSESAFRRVGLALGRIEGVSATQPVAALNSHEVTYKGQTFLVRLTAQGEQVRVDAISPEGAVLSGGAAGDLLGLLQARLQ